MSLHSILPLLFVAPFDLLTFYYCRVNDDNRVNAASECFKRLPDCENPKIENALKLDLEALAKKLNAKFTQIDALVQKYPYTPACVYTSEYVLQRASPPHDLV